MNLLLKCLQLSAGLYHTLARLKKTAQTPADSGAYTTAKFHSVGVDHRALGFLTPESM